MNIQIIAPSYARNDVMKDIVSDDKNPFDKQVLSLSAFKNSLLLQPQDLKEEQSYLFGNIKNHISKDNIFYNQLSFPTFFYYFYDFAKLLIRYGVQIQDLPENDTQDKSKKEILSYFLNNNIIEKQIEDSINKTESFSNVEIRDYFYPDLADKKDIDKLINKGARFIIDDIKHNTGFTCRYANNPVKEVIGVAQEIVLNKTDISKYVIMLNDRETYIPIIQRIFEYYQIPYRVRFSKPSFEAQRFVALLNFIRNQDMNSFIHAYNYRCFYKSDYRLIDYINTVNLVFEQLYKPLGSVKEVLNDKDKQEYIQNTFGIQRLNSLVQNEDVCEQIMSEIRPVLQNMKECQDKPLYEQCSYVYNILYSDIEADEIDKTAVNEIQDIHNLCRSIVNKNTDNYQLLVYELMKLQSDQSIEYDNGIRIVDVGEDVKDCDNAIILGCIQQNYPRSVAMSGFFDEEYISRVNNYPTLIERNDYSNNQYSKLLNIFKEVIFSYPMANIDGNQYQRSTLISDYVDSVDKDGKKVLVESPWKYSEIDSNTKISEKISKDVAKAMYLKNGMLKASPSSFEQYVNCPFAYFIKRGLRIEDEAQLKIEASTIGSIQHHLLEKSFKNEVELNQDSIEEYLTPYFDLIKEVIQNKEEEIDATKTRLADGLKNSVEFLNEFRKTDDYDYYPEEKIENYVWKLGDNKLLFSGKIDRLDKKGDNYRIIDYKSSEKSVNLSNVKKGINFQLLSYLVLYYLQCNNKNLVPELFAYLSLKNGKIKKDFNDKTDRELRREDIKYSAYLIDDIVLDDRFFNTKNLTGSRKQSDEGKTDFDGIRIIVEKLFATIANNILSGDISIEPKNGACDFCNYSELCRFNGDVLSKDEMEDLTI